jgi:uncharacterized protein DUF2171
MQERYLGRLESGLDVCDVRGDKIGTVARVYRKDPALISSGTSAAPPRDEVLEVKTGFLGLGKHLFIPLSAIQEVNSGCVFLGRTKDEAEEAGWTARPSYLDELD